MLDCSFSSKLFFCVYFLQDTLVKFRQFFNKKTDNFVIIIQYQQARNIIVRGQVSITTYRTTLRGVAEFKYCPNTEFCRIAVKPAGTGDFFRIRQGTTRVEVRFPVKLDVQVVSIALSLQRKFQSNVKKAPGKLSHCSNFLSVFVLCTQVNMMFVMIKIIILDRQKS
jgi:hypothetical protein